MFYKTGVDITNSKQMFYFLKNHFEYDIMNSQNHSKTIANNVKLHKLELSGDWSVTYDLLNTGGYDEIAWILNLWMINHPGYIVQFNGRSNGYLILRGAVNNTHVLPLSILDSATYEDYKAYCKEYFGSVKENLEELRYYTKLVQDFDKLCDELREYCDLLSTLKFEIVEMETVVEHFNNYYFDDLLQLGFQCLTCDELGRVDISEIRKLDSLFEAFYRLALRPDSRYRLSIDNQYIKYVRK